MCLAWGRFVWAISGIGQFHGLVCSRAQEKKRKNRCLRWISRMRSHASFEPIVIKFCMWGRVSDMITDAKFYGNRLRGFRVIGPHPPKRHFLYLTFIALTTVSALPCHTMGSSPRPKQSSRPTTWFLWSTRIPSLPFTLHIAIMLLYIKKTAIHLILYKRWCKTAKIKKYKHELMY